MVLNSDDDMQGMIWDHGLKEIADHMDKMDSITSEYVDMNWKNTEFAKFCFENAMQVSHTPQGAIDKIKEREDEFWGMMHPSDIAYAVTKRVNNEERWMAQWMRDKGKKTS